MQQEQIADSIEKSPGQYHTFFGEGYTDSLVISASASALQRPLQASRFIIFDEVTIALDDKSKQAAIEAN